MTKAAARRHRQRPGAERRAARRTLDNGVYATVLLVSAFILLIWFFLDPPGAGSSFWHGVVGCIAAILGWINFVAIKAFRGAKLPDWQMSLAKIPLRFAGYGTDGGKPIEAAHGQRNARNAVFSFLGVSVVVVLLLAVLVIPEMQWW